MELYRTVVWIFIVFLYCETRVCVTNKNCRERKRLIGTAERDMFQIVDAEVHQTVKLLCHYCHEKDDSLPKVWYKQDMLLHNTAVEVQLDIETNRVRVTSHHTLVIQNVTTADTAIYYCHGADGEDQVFKFNYLLDVVMDEMQPTVGDLMDWRKYHKSQLLPINEQFKHQNLSLLAVTQWESWGPCVACNRLRGERRRLGKCQLKQNSTFFAEVEVSELSCHSALVTRVFPNISRIVSSVPDFIQTDTCSRTCTVGEKEYKKGTKIVKSRHILPHGGHLTLACPKATLQHVVTWMKNGGAIEPESHTSIDMFGTLHLTDVTEAEEGNYTCLMDDAPVLESDVIVLTQSGVLREVLQHMSYLGLVFVLSCVCYCANVVVTWRRRHQFVGYSNLPN